MFDPDIVPTWLYAILAIVLLALIAYLVIIWRKHRAMTRKNADILRARRKDEARWNALQEEQRKRQSDQPSA